MLRRMLRTAILVFLAVVLLGVLRFVSIFDAWAALEIDREPVPALAAERASRRVLLVSVDGLAPRVLEAVETPFLDRLAQDGLVATRARTVTPSVTMTSHASMLSGQTPDEHGIFFNRFEPWRELTLPTLFSVCWEVGLACGLFAGKKKFVHFAEHEPGVERYRFASHAQEVLDAAASWVEARDPDFVFVHLAEVDITGHTEGWDGSTQRATIVAFDRLLETAVDRMRLASERPLTILLTADHGGIDKGHHQDRPENRDIPWILSGPGILPGRLPTPISTVQTAATVAALLGVRSPNGSAPVSFAP